MNETPKCPLKVLSLFDGISCGRLALERAGIPVERYVAYEIEHNAIKISRKNWPRKPTPEQMAAEWEEEEKDG